MLSAFLVGCQSLVATAEPIPTRASRQDYSGKKIVWVDSYHQGYEWSDGIEAGLRSALDGSGVELKVVRLDTKRNPTEDFARTAGNQAKAEIDQFKPDILIATDDNAQKYVVLPYYKDTDLPVVFAGVNWDASIYDYPAQNVTGMIEVELPLQLVGHLKDYAQGNRIGYLTVDSETERKVVGIYNQRFFDGGMTVYYVKTLAEFQQQFLAAQNEVDMLIIGTNAGIDRWDEQEVEDFMRVNTSVPTGTMYDWLAPYVLVTVAKKAAEQGEWAGKTALDILSGVPIAQIPLTENKHGVLILNLDVAEELGLIFSPSMLRYAQVYTARGGGS